ncbi:MAG: senescence marker protein-30 [Porticoccaceae bacterium]|nr:MAG: senescence marker protein-30 [Porticoccaceae bacterium]
MTPAVRRLPFPRCQGGEQPLWDEERGELWCIDNSGCRLHRWRWGEASCETFATPAVVTALGLTRRGDLLVALRTGLFRFDPREGSYALLQPLPEPPPYVYNDAVVDPAGRWPVGVSTARFARPAPDGGLARLDADGALHWIERGIHFSNGPRFSPDGTAFYFSDSWLHRIYAYDYDAERGLLANRRVFAETRSLGGMPDGAAVDEEGRLWVALYGAGRIACFTPDGRLEGCVEVPARLVSSVTFAGPKRDVLCVTTIARAHGQSGDEAEAGAGHVYAIEGLAARGPAEARYAG